MEKRKIVVSSITVAVLLVLVVASTYAYFQARITNGGQTSTNVTAKTLDSFAINTGRDISLVATQDNFGSGKGDLSSSTTATVTFTARSDAASEYAYIPGFYIKSNNFVYSSAALTKSIDSLYAGCSTLTTNNGIYTTPISGECTIGHLNVYTRPKWVDDPKFSEYYAFEDKVLEIYIKTSNANNISIDDITFNILLRDYDIDNSPSTDAVINSKRELVTSDGTKYYVLNISTYNIQATPATSMECIMEFSDNVTSNSSSVFSIYEGLIILDKTNVTEETDISDMTELELTVKKNGTLVGTYDITGKTSGDYVYFKDMPTEDEMYNAADAKAWLCLYSRLSEKDLVKYATIAACGNDLDCMDNAYQQMINDCNGDETCLNALDDDVDDMFNRYANYCIEQSKTEIIAQQGYRISANAGAKTTDTWEATVTFKNLNTNQNINVGKSFEGYFYFESAKDYNWEINNIFPIINGGGILHNSGIIE